jgi:hypothetical protein
MMSKHRRHRWRLRLLLALALLAGLTLAGCNTWYPRQPVSTPPDANWGRKLRPTGAPGNAVGFDRRARQIEQNLGVR